MQFVAQFQEDGNTVAFMKDNRTRILIRNSDGVFTDGTYSLSGSPETPITIYENGVPVLNNCAPVTHQEQYYRKYTQFRFFNPTRDLQ